jgi:hypothetical protein
MLKAHRVSQMTRARRSLRKERTRYAPALLCGRFTSADDLKSPEVIDLDSGDESDGQSAARASQEAQAGCRKGPVRRGPPNESEKHFYPPKPIEEGTGKKKQLKWEFTCCYCGSAYRKSSS